MSLRSISSLRVAFVLLSCVGVAAVASAQEPQPRLTVPEEKFCTDPRPEMCTEDYRPVCGFTKDGVHRTYSNACFACAKTDVVRYTMGKCKID